MTAVAGIDIGGTTTQVVLCAPDLGVLDRLGVPTPAAEGGTAMIGAALDALQRLLDRTPAKLLGVGVGAAGVVDARAGRILVASDSFRGWAGFAVTAAVERALGVPAFLDNDVNAFLRGEVAKGAALGSTHVLGMTLGTGVGGALWLDGALYDGPRGAAGEIGHVPGFGDLPCTCGGRGRGDRGLGPGDRRSLRRPHGPRGGPGRPPGRPRRARRIRDGRYGGGPGAADHRGPAGRHHLRDRRRSRPHLAPPRPAHPHRPRRRPPVSGHPLHVLPARLGEDAAAIGAAARAGAELGVGTPV